MAVKNYNVSEARFKMADPTFMYQLSKDMNARHEKLEEQFADYGALAGAMEQYAMEDPEGETAKMYKRFSSQLQAASEALAKGGINGIDRSTIVQLKPSYGQNIIPIINAQERRVKAIETYDAKMIQDPSYIGIDPRAQSINAFLKETPSFAGISGDAIRKSALESSALASSERHLPVTFSSVGHGYLKATERTGYTNEEQMAIMNTLMSGNQDAINKMIQQDPTTSELAKYYITQMNNAKNLFGENSEQYKQYQNRVITGMYDGMNMQEKNSIHQDWQAAQAAKKSAAEDLFKKIKGVRGAGVPGTSVVTIGRDGTKEFDHFMQLNEKGDYIMKNNKDIAGGVSPYKLKNGKVVLKSAEELRKEAPISTRGNYYSVNMSSFDEIEYNRLVKFYRDLGINPYQDCKGTVKKGSNVIDFSELHRIVNSANIGGDYFDTSTETNAITGNIGLSYVDFNINGKAKEYIAGKVNGNKKQVHELSRVRRDNGQFIAERGKVIKHDIKPEDISSVRRYPIMNADIVELQDGTNLTIPLGIMSGNDRDGNKTIKLNKKLQEQAEILTKLAPKYVNKTINNEEFLRYNQAYLQYNSILNEIGYDVSSAFEYLGGSSVDERSEQANDDAQITNAILAYMSDNN